MAAVPQTLSLGLLMPTDIEELLEFWEDGCVSYVSSRSSFESLPNKAEKNDCSPIMFLMLIAIITSYWATVEWINYESLANSLSVINTEECSNCCKYLRLSIFSFLVLNSEEERSNLLLISIYGFLSSGDALLFYYYRLQ